jgi:hypothetical protein
MGRETGLLPRSSWAMPFVTAEAARLTHPCGGGMAYVPNGAAPA